MTPTRTRIGRRFLPALLSAIVLLAVAGIIHAGDSARKKARYYYSAGIVEKAQGNEDRAYEYFKKAYTIDPTYSEAAFACANGRLVIPIDTLQSDTEIARTLSMMRQFVDEYPGDSYESQYYGYLATQTGDLDEAVRVLERTAKNDPSRTATLMQLSEAYYADNDYERAVEALDRYERLEGLSTQLTTRKISLLLAKKDTVAVMREISKLVDSDPRNVSFNILKGNVFDVLEQKDSALYYYLHAERLDPESGSAKLALAGFYQQEGDSIKYDSKMYEVLFCEDLDLDMKTDMVAEYLQTIIAGKGDTERGDRLFSVLREQNPHEPHVLDLAARYSAAKGNYDEAVEEISYAVDLDPTEINYWGQLMTYQTVGGHPEESLATYERAKSHITPDYDLKTVYAMGAQMAKQYDKAIGVYREFIADIQKDLEPDSLLSLSDLRRDISVYELDRLSSLFATTGDIYHVAGENQKAYRYYENAITFNPSNNMAYNNYAYFLAIDGGDLDKALELSSKSLSGEDTSNPIYLDTYAWIHYLKGDYATAETWQKKAIEEAEKKEYESADIYDHLGDIQEKLSQLPEALESWHKAVKMQEEKNETEEESYQLTKAKIKEAAAKLGVPVP